MAQLALANPDHWRGLENVGAFQVQGLLRPRTQADSILAQVVLFLGNHVIIHFVNPQTVSKHLLRTRHCALHTLIGSSPLPVREGF